MPGLLRAARCAPIVEYLITEFPERPKIVADVVARLADDRILHLEFQVRNDPRMHWRCFHYFGAIQEQWEDAEVIQVVIYLGNAPMSMSSEIRRPGPTYDFKIPDMRTVPAQMFLESGNDAERVLAVLCESLEPRTLCGGFWRRGRVFQTKCCARILSGCGRCRNCGESR